MRLVRYADDFLLTFERRADADRMATALAERLAKFGLRLHEDKTRLIEFGRFAATNRQRRSEGRPETFDFLGFTHYCGKTLDGRFMVHRKTQRGRMVRKLKELRQELKRRMHTRLRVGGERATSKPRPFDRALALLDPYVDGPLLARVFVQCSDQIACVHMSGLLSRSHMNAGQDGFRDTSSKHCCDL